MNKRELTAGLKLLQQPIIPLVNIVQFLFITGDFQSIEDIIREMPDEIETAHSTYKNSQKILQSHLNSLRQLENIKSERKQGITVIDEAGNQVDTMTAVTCQVNQLILENELETINSALCGPCNCTLCCTGPEPDIEQEFFEIPLTENELSLFNLEQYDTRDSRSTEALAAEPLQVNGRPFYQRSQPALFHWRNGWSLILPTGSSCPGLQKSGKCNIYSQRPQVCRKPQIFGYILENNKQKQYVLRNTLLAVIDCPYVSTLKDEIATYAAASDLQMIFRHNKQ